MNAKKPPAATSEALEDALASFACEVIFFSEEEEKLLRDMEAKNLPHEERMARIQAFLRERR